ncbi:hypothetical protein D3C71_1835490 [compost metagenome]
MVRALGNSSKVRSKGIWGISKVGNDEGNSPNLLPMVSTGVASAAREQTSKAIRKAGALGAQRLSIMITPSPNAVIPIAAGCRLPR